MVLCDACLPEQIDASGASLFPAQPHDQNNRAACLEMVSRAHSRRPWVTFVQELTLIDPSSEWPLGWSSKGLPLTAQLQGLLVGTRSAPQGRDVAELHARFCVHAGVKITKFGPRDVPGVWYFQVGAQSHPHVMVHSSHAALFMGRSSTAAVF